MDPNVRSPSSFLLRIWWFHRLSAERRTRGGRPGRTARRLPQRADNPRPDGAPAPSEAPGGCLRPRGSVLGSVTGSARLELDLLRPALGALRQRDVQDAVGQPGLHRLGGDGLRQADDPLEAAVRATVEEVAPGLLGLA